MGRILMIEFDDRDTAVFDEIMRALEKHPSFEQFRLRGESTLSLPELDIFLQRRKAYSGYTEIPLTAKEFDILCMLAANKGSVLTYDQIYHRLWKEDSDGNVSNTVGCHVRSLRRKLHKAIPELGFEIRCVRDIGYCLEIKKKDT